MKRVITFIQKVIWFKIIGIKSPSLEWAGIDSRKKSFRWYWKQSRGAFNAWGHLE